MVAMIELNKKIASRKPQKTERNVACIKKTKKFSAYFNNAAIKAFLIAKIAERRRKTSSSFLHPSQVWALQGENNLIRVRQT